MLYARPILTQDRTAMLHNDSVKNFASIPALVISAAIHAAIVVAVAPSVTVAYARHAGGQPTESLRNAVLGFGLFWCVVAAVWSAAATAILGNPSNRWGGLRFPKVIYVVAGLTLALDVVNSFCLFNCPATFLALPILTYVALYNNSQPIENEDSGPAAHG